MDKVDINKHEFSVAEWLNPTEAINKYYEDKFPLLLPQFICICHFTLMT